MTLAIGPNALPLPPGAICGSPDTPVPGALSPGLSSRLGGPVGGFDKVDGLVGSVLPAPIGFGPANELAVPAAGGFSATIGFDGPVFDVSAGFGAPTEFAGPAAGGTDVVAGFVGFVFTGPTGLGAPAVLAAPPVVGRFATVAGCFGGSDILVTLRTTAVTAPTALLNADLTTARVAGTGDFAVVVHVPADCLGLLQVDVL
jgi:hypothetical protein